MAVTPSKYQYQRRVTEEKFDASVVTQTDTGAAEVLRPSFVLADAEDGAARLKITSGNVKVSDPALAVKSVGIDESNMILQCILDELKEIKMHLNLITEFER